jgi:hypothetical protein
MYVADKIGDKFDGITAQTPKPRLTLWQLRCDKHLIMLRPCSTIRVGRVVVVVVIIIIQTIAIKVLLADSSTCSNNVGSANVDNVWVAHDAIIEMMEHNVTLDTQ